MLVKELESLLGITKDNIRYYESEGLIHPRRKDNGYRDYSEEDAERLKKVLVLRKLGVPVAEIRDLFSGTKDLKDVLEKTHMSIEQEIASMNEAKQMCEEIEKNTVSINDLDADRYLSEIAEKKPSGFNDLSKDVLSYTSGLFIESFGHFQWFFPIFKPLLWKRKRKGSAVLAVIVLALLILSAGSICWQLSIRNNNTNGWFRLKGMATMCTIILIWLLLRNIVYFTSKKFAKHEKAIAVTGAILSALVSILLYYGAMLHWSRVLMFRPYNDPPVFLDASADHIQIIEDDEIAFDTNDWKQSHKSEWYRAYDQNYISEVRSAIEECEPTGIWSVTSNAFTLLDAQKETGKPEKFWQILYQNTENHRYTFFYVIKNSEGEWLLDEPAYGVFKASDRLMDLIREYDEHITIDPAVPEQFKQYFEYDPEKIWPGDYEDGRFDTYRYLTIKDSDGNEITEHFLDQHRDLYDNQDWDALLEVFENVSVMWKEEYVNPEAAHMEGTIH